jgi:peptidoglycan/LPS O-acetylase OafA/YrhL
VRLDHIIEMTGNTRIALLDRHTNTTVSIALFGSLVALPREISPRYPNELPDDNRDLEPPDPMPNSEVKQIIANGSVALRHVRVGHRQASKGIIVSGLEVGKFSVLNFYFARINRIIPALLLLCLMLLALGWFLLAPDDYEILAKHVKDTLLFVSNNTYRKESGYFDVLSHEKWLLHTWSLSVEWQFYLILPVFLYVAWLINKKRRWLFSVVFVVFLYSLVSCILKTNEAPTKAFYMIKYRYWEMLAGGLVYFLSDFLRDKISRGAGTVVYVASILGVLLPVFFVTSESHWPGYLALIPVLGAAAFILVNRSDLAVVNNKAVVWVGERSYSIYLWHWPAVVLLDYFQLLSSIYLVAFGVLGSFVVAELSYRLIENPFRKRRNSVVWVVPAIVLLASVGVCAMALGVIKLKGLPDRVDPVVVKLAAIY